MIYKLIKFLTWLQARVDRVTCNSIIHFACVYGGYYVSNPAEPAGKVKPDWLLDMIAKTKEKQAQGQKKASVPFIGCPGMHDYAQEGYIIRAHTDIHIKANRAGTVISMPHLAEGMLQFAQMNMEVVDGMAPFHPDVAKQVFKIPIPYGMYMEPGHSAHLMPALMHSPFLDKLWVYPGTVDYDDFHVMNFIFSAIKECEFTITAGTPLLQVLPFKRVAYHAISGPATQLQSDQSRFGFPSRQKAYYRKMFHKKKLYTSEAVK
jgi:hypothetical protein